MIQHRPSSSSLQQNIVHHSNINDSSTTTTAAAAAAAATSSNRFDFNYSNENEPTKRQRNSLMTVYEQGSTNDLLVDEKWQLKAIQSTADTIPQRTTDDKPVV